MFKILMKIFNKLENLFGFYLNIFFSRLSKPSKLKILQWKRLVSLFNEYNCKSLLEFGSGRSTIFFLNNLNNIHEFLSINPNSEIKFTEIVREKYKLLNIKKNCKIINTKTEISNFQSKNSINFIYPFLDKYDLIYIDGPSKKVNGSHLIHNILTLQIKSKIFFFDGRTDVANELIKVLKKNNISYNTKTSSILNYTIIFV